MAGSRISPKNGGKQTEKIGGRKPAFFAYGRKAIAALLRFLRKISPAFPVCAAAAIFVFARLSDPFADDTVFCFVNRASGLHCGTCGLTRAAYCLTEGDIRGAFYYHFFFAAGLIPAILLSTAYLVNFSAGKRAIPLPRPKWAYFYLLLALFVAFLIFRNATDIVY